MNKIEIRLSESEESVIALSYMMSNIQYRKKYCDFLINNKVEFPHPTIQTLSNLLVRNKNKEDMLLDYKILQQVNDMGYLSTILDNAYSKVNEAITIAFLERIQGEKEKISPIKYTEDFTNCKKAFLAFCSGKIKYFPNTPNKNFPFIMKSQNSEWKPISEDYMLNVYNKFIENCETELDIFKHNMSVLKESITEDQYTKMKKLYDERCDMVDSWDSSTSAYESINKIKRDEHFIYFNTNKENKIIKERNLEY